jgi:transposase
MKGPMNQEKKLKRNKRVFDEAFRREAVALMQSSDEPLAQIATKLGVSQWNLRDWREQYGSSSGNGKPSKAAATEAMRAEVARLRRENESLKAQRDILKKALGILAEPPNSASRE